jgi:hypothetical protein
MPKNKKLASEAALVKEAIRLGMEYGEKLGVVEFEPTDSAFSCKCRGFCPSCGARRMVETAAGQVEHVFPRVPVRQWEATLSAITGSSRPCARRVECPLPPPRRAGTTARLTGRRYPHGAVARPRSDDHLWMQRAAAASSTSTSATARAALAHCAYSP